jgi:hypothetical protein
VEGKRLGYELGYDTGGTFIVCLECGLQSYNPEYIRTLYCGCCHKFLGDSEARGKIVVD